MELRQVAVTDPGLKDLLQEYFEFRQRNALTHGQPYHVALPNPEQFLPPTGEFVVAAQDDGALLGCGGLRQLEGPNVYEVKNLWTRREARGRGVGTSILARLEADARSWGARRLRLDTNRVLADAISLYRKSGFVSIAPYNENPNATHWFEKTLTDE